MSDTHAYPLLSNRRRVALVMLPALLFSAVVHVTAGSVLLRIWQLTPMAASQPLTVSLAAAVPPQPAIDIPPPLPKRNPMKLEPGASSEVMPGVPLAYAPAPSLIAPEQVEAVPPAATVAPQTLAAPGPASQASSAASARRVADATEALHFKVTYLNNPPPAYPPLARKLGLEGRVVLRVRVIGEGAPEQVTVAQTSGAPVLDDAALKAVQGWTFVPARRGDTPVAHWVDVPIRFQLKN